MTSGISGISAVYVDTEIEKLLLRKLFNKIIAHTPHVQFTSNDLILLLFFIFHIPMKHTVVSNLNLFFA